MRFGQPIIRVRLEPGIVYTWSVSVILNPKARSRDIVASASLMRTVAEPTVEAALRAASPNRRAAILAQAGLWYDAVAAAAETASLDRHAALDALMTEVGLLEPARYDRETARRRCSRPGQPPLEQRPRSLGNRVPRSSIELPTVDVAQRLAVIEFRS